ncbi:MAG: Type 2 DNA topoisomerase 6 subunit B [Phycisphaerae bacterium]|nr:Type 2 DNA topoisomerase 6 subunit B [Phycisphaerae bacterium]
MAETTIARKPRRREATPSLFDLPKPVRGAAGPADRGDGSKESPPTGAERVEAVATPEPSNGDGAPPLAPGGEVSAFTAEEGVGPRKPARRATAESMASKQREISISEFFAKNRHLLGFDNKRKALLTTIKEAVDNSLDACEEAGILPDVWVDIDQINEERFRVTVRDNGPGIVKAQIPNIFGKLLYGSKFHRLKMSRGQQGIGISAAGMYGMLTTGKGTVITSRTGPGRDAHHFELQINTAKNRPEIVKDETVAVEWDHGTSVTIELAATYQRGRQSVDEYLEQTAIANPHAAIYYKMPTGERREFPRSNQELPPEAKEIKPHPHGIELGVLIKMLNDAGVRQKGHRVPSLTGFLQEQFSRVTGRVAATICETAKIGKMQQVTQLGSAQIEKLYQAIQTTKLMAPPTDCLVPIGARAILSGLLKEVKAEFYTATTREPAVYRGNPFAIEVGLAFGGALEAESAARVIRFANRVPLLYQQSACCIYKAVVDLEWRRYGISQPSGALPVAPLVVMVHMASVWVPFTSESKEAIADYDEIRKEIRLALLECGRKLQAYVNRRKKQRYEGERRSVFERYIGEVVAAVNTIKPIDTEELGHRLLEIARHRTARADETLDDAGRPIEGRVADESAAAAAKPGRAAKGGRTMPADAANSAGERSIVAAGASAGRSVETIDETTLVVEQPAPLNPLFGDEA